MSKQRVLFLCTGNSCRSQMAEGLARALISDAVTAFSAGTRPHGVNPLAVRVMQEIGIDISHHQSKHLDELKSENVDYVVTVCDNAREQCPLWLDQGIVLHQSFDDPPALAANARSEEEALQHYRRVRDEIAEFITALPARLQRGT